ncbi:MAG: FAD-binding oxidoreductase [Myxococcota bacterium]
MLTEEQKRVGAAVLRVLRRRVGEWRRERSGDRVADLAELLRSVKAMVGRAPPVEARAERVRSFWGWGYEGEGPDPLAVEVLLEYAAERFGLDGFPEIAPPRLEDIALRPPRFALPPELAGFCTDDALERVSHSYGKAFRDIVRALHCRYENPTDYVATPETEAQVQALLRFCEAEGVAMSVYGGGTSVVGGVNPTTSARYRGTLTVDMRRFDRLLEVDPVSRAVRAQAGILGPALEEALKPHGLSPRFYPQSFEFSTLGGWIATRAGGHFCTLYTHIDDILEAVRVVTPAGVHETRRLPASGAGISQERLWLGSEGTLGVITEAWIRVHARPRHRASTAVKFATFAAGAAAVRELAQSKLYPANCRLVDLLEATMMGLGDGKHAMLLLGFESESHAQADALERAMAICRAHGGRPSRAKITEAGVGARSGSAGSWRNNFLKAPYLRDILARKGLVTETFETAVPWERFERLHGEILAAAERAFDAHCAGRGLITCRFTHVYPDGPAPYYSVVAWAPEGRQLETWDAIKASVSDAILAHGGTITHHHAVGRDHRPWYERERGELMGQMLRGLKTTLDPAWVLNPGVLLEVPETEGT